MKETEEKRKRERKEREAKKSGTKARYQKLRKKDCNIEISISHVPLRGRALPQKSALTKASECPEEFILERFRFYIRAK